MKRQATVNRKTKEVKCSITLNLDGSGKFDVKTGIPFFNHMLEQFAKHGYFDLKIKAIGDTEIDFHHTVEDTGIVLGDAIDKSLGDKKGIRRFAHASVPFDDSLVSVTLDISGRPYFVFRGEIPKSKVGEFDVELAEEFFKSLANSIKCNLHIELKYGTNLHHNIEAMFKAVGIALDEATSIDTRSKAIPSTKGTL
jgi:imidazoleglycerol-phosphate dehydratase